MEKLKLFKESIDKKPSQLTQEEWDSGDYLLSPKGDDIVLPWDADVTIEGDNLKIVGCLAPGSGYSDKSKCEITVNKNYADKLYDVLEV